MTKTHAASGLILIVSIWAAWFVLGAATASGQERPPLVPRHAVELGLTTGYLEYEEDIDVEWDGFMYGLTAGYTFHDQWMFSAGLDYMYGRINYDGRTQGGTPVREDADDHILEGRGLVGRDFAIQGHLVTPFTGLGYRYWSDDVEGAGSYLREVTYLYSPIGVQTLSPVSPNWTWGVTAEYDLFWDGKVTSHLSEAVIGYNDPENDQDSGYGLRFSVSFTHHSGFYIQPYVRYWDIDRSDLATLTQFGIPIGYAYEPANDTTIFGVRVGRRF